MPLFVTFLHVILCIALILIILLQPGKDSASVFGGGAGNQMYGPRGSGNVLGRATTAVAVMFMVTSITLALYSSETAQQGSNIEDEILRLEREGGFNSRKEEAPAPALPEAPAEQIIESSPGDASQPGEEPVDDGILGPAEDASGQPE